MTSAARCVVVDEKIVRVPSRLRQCLHGFLIRLRNGTQGNRLAPMHHSHHDPTSIQARVFRRNEQNLCGVARFPRALQQLGINDKVLDGKGALRCCLSAALILS